MMDDHSLLLRLHARLATTELKAVLAEDPRLVSLVENSLRRARELVEQRRVLEAQVWLAGITAVVERRWRERVAAKQRQEERVANFGGDPRKRCPGKRSRGFALACGNTSARRHQRTPRCCRK